jgi:hypothetical protein
MAQVDVGLPIPLGNYSYLPPVQTGMNDAEEEKAMNPLLAWLAGQGIDVAAEKTGIKDVLRERGSGLLEMFGIGNAQAAETPDMPPVQTGFQPTTSVVAQDVIGTPIPEASPSYVPDSQIPMEGRRLPGREQILVRQDWEGAGRGPAGGVTGNQDGVRQLPPISQWAMADSTPPASDKEIDEVIKKSEPDSMLGRLWDSTLGDEEWRLRKAMILNSMRLNPDAALTQAFASRIKDLRDTKRGNKTADVLLERGLITQSQADAIKLGALSYKDILGGDAIAKYRWLLDNPEEAKKLKELGAIGSGTNITIGDKGETKLQEEIGKGLGTKITEDFNAGTQARSALDSVELLMGLSENLESATSIPPALRNLVPEGVSDPIDAYRGVMTNVAKSLRIKGEGTMSDRDIDLLIRQAGPVTSNPQARRIMQESLKRKAEINLQLSKAASDFMLERISRRQYLDRVNEINNIPLMDERMRSYISSLGGGAAKPAGGQVKVISVE